MHRDARCVGYSEGQQDRHAFFMREERETETQRVGAKVKIFQQIHSQTHTDVFPSSAFPAAVLLYNTKVCNNRPDIHEAHLTSVRCFMISCVCSWTCGT